MDRVFKISLALCLVFLLSSPVLAMNGDNLIGVGPVSRTMGGVGVATPQDAITALFANPAAISTSQADFSATIPIPMLALRAGFNYGKNPVEVHDGFDPLGITEVQGKNVPTVNYEVLRILGAPLIIEKHVAIGVGYDVTERITVNIGYAHGFEETISETSLASMARLESTVEGDTYEFGITWRF